MHTQRINRTRFSLIILLLLSFGVVLLILAFLAKQSPGAQAAGVIHYVAPGGSCGVSPCYSSVQTAMDAATSNDEIRVAAGTYTGVNNRGGLSQMVYISKTVTIRGGYTTANWNISNPATNVTVLNAQYAGRVLYITGSISPTIEGFWLTSGNASSLGGDPWFGHDAGGGIYVITATATISNNQIVTNAAGNDFGGGVYLNRSSALLHSNTIDNNSAGSGGGVGIWFGNNSLVKNSIINNSNNGIWLYGYTATFSENTISNNSTDFNGGGVELYYGGAYFDHNVITQNSAAGNGGGVSLATYSGAQFDGDLITDNTADSNGGGVYVSWHSNGRLFNTVLADNEATGLGSGLYLDSSTVKATHTTFAGNSNGDGRGLYANSQSGIYSSVMLTNTIMSAHNVGISVTSGNTVTMDSILWHSTPLTISKASGSVVSVQNQITGDPAFAADGYHLTPGSAAVDAGVSSGVSEDIDGELRTGAGLPDLGADELVSILTINYEAGAPGSYFTLSGNNFPPNDTATITLNGRTLGTVPTDADGSFTFLLNSSGAEEGAYMVTATVNPSANRWFTLDAAAPTRPQEGTGPTFAIPAGIAFDEFVYLPTIVR